MLLATTGVIVQGLIGQGVVRNIGFIDPNIYLGYSMIGPALNEEFGWTYYQTRIPLIIVLNILLRVFGSAGATVYSLGLAGLLCAVPAIFLHRLKVSILAGLSVGLLVSQDYFLQRAIGTTYTNGISIILFLYALAAVHHYLISRNLRSLGTAMALAVSLVYLHPINAFLLAGSLFSTIFISIPSSAIDRTAVARIHMRFAIASGALTMLAWEIIYNSYFEQLTRPQSALLQSFFMSRELRALDRWAGYPGLIQTIDNNPKWLFLLAPVIQILLIVLLRQSLRQRQGDEQILLLGKFCLLQASSVLMILTIQWLVLGAPIFSTMEYASYFSIPFFLVVLGVSVVWRQKILVVAGVFFVWFKLSGSNFLDDQDKVVLSKIYSPGSFPNLVIATLLVSLLLYFAISRNQMTLKRLVISLTLLLSFLAIARHDESNTYLKPSDFINRQTLFLDDFRALATRWRTESWGDKTAAVFYRNDAEAYLGSLQSGLVFGPTNLSGLSGNGQTINPSYDFWNCGRFWSTRPKYLDCELVNRNLVSPPSSIIAMYELAEANAGVQSLKDETQFQRLGYFKILNTSLPSSRVEIVVWHRKAAGANP